jgi:hypothetical protein
MCKGSEVVSVGLVPRGLCVDGEESGELDLKRAVAHSFILTSALLSLLQICYLLSCLHPLYPLLSGP